MGYYDDHDMIPKSMMPSGGGCCIPFVMFAVCVMLVGVLIFG